MKEEFNPLERATEILTALPKGILLTTASSDGSRYNSMTIGWGGLNVDWALPVFVAYVRQSRYTHELLEATGEFTVNIPAWDTVAAGSGKAEGADSTDAGADTAADAATEQQKRIRRILGYCGSASGRDIDKFAELGLTPTESTLVRAPGILELPVTLECKVIYQEEQPLSSIKDEALQDRWYPPATDADSGQAVHDTHTIYYGQILSAYISS